MLFCPRLDSLKIVQRCPNFAAFAAAVKIFGFAKHMAHDAVAMRLGAGLAKAVVGRGGELGVFGVTRGLVAMRAFNYHQLQACGLHSGYKILRVGREREWGVAMGAGGVHGRQPENGESGLFWLCLFSGCLMAWECSRAA